MTFAPSTSTKLMDVTARGTVYPLLALHGLIGKHVPSVAAPACNGLTWFFGAVSGGAKGVGHEVIADVPCDIFTPTSGNPESTMVYYHGGGFVILSTAAYRTALQYMANKLNATIIAPDYILMQDSNLDDLLSSCIDVYAAVREREEGKVLVGGDSAGGFISLYVTAEMAMSDAIPTPDGCIALSPMIDTRPEKKAQWFIGKRDALFPVSVLQMVHDMAVSTGSTIFEVPVDQVDPSTLPPVIIHASADEMFLHDALHVESVWGKGKVKLTAFPGQIHAWHIFASVLGDARKAICILADQVDELVNVR